MSDSVLAIPAGAEPIEVFKGRTVVDTTVDRDEDTLFTARVRTYRFDSASKEWKERGVGALKILRNQKTGLHTVVCRRDQTFKLAMQFPIAPKAELLPPPSGKGFTVSAFDFSDDEAPEGRSDIFVIQFKLDSEVDEFKKTFEAAAKANEKLFEEKAEAKTEEKTEAKAEVEDAAKALADM